MADVHIDTARTAIAASVWARTAEEIGATSNRWWSDVSSLGLGSVPSGALAHVRSATTELETVALATRLVVDHVLAADELSLPLELDRSGVADLFGLARSLVLPSGGVPRFPLPPQAGDRGGTFGGDAREPFVLTSAGSLARGREVVSRALRDAGNSRQIAADEFEIVRMSDGRYLVVLPGVTDLSDPALGLDPRHRSVRDLDRYAYESSRSTGIDGNGYARSVADALAVRGVPVGAELVLIGHSYGADTALDLAADPAFNGETGYRVTHVVAAAYYSDPQLRHVPDSTDVLVLQNSDDAAVIAEAVGDAHVVDAIDAHIDVGRSLIELDPVGVVVDSGRAWWHRVNVAREAVEHLVDRGDDLVDVAVATASGDLSGVVDGVDAVVTLEPGVRVPRAGQVVAVFEGGGAGAGHHPSNYVDYVTGTDDPDVTAFLASLGGALPTTGSAWSIDVSVP